MTNIDAVKLLHDKHIVTIAGSAGKNINGIWVSECIKCNTWVDVWYKGIKFEVRDCEEHRKIE